MKKLFFALAAVLVLAASCTKNEVPTISFDKQVYVLLSDGSVDLKVNLSSATPTEIKIPLTFSGAAVMNEDYTVSDDFVTIKAGESSGSVTVFAYNNFAESTINVSLGAVVGFDFGKYSSATVTVDAKEKIIFSFSTATATVLDSYVVKLNLSGVTSGSSFVASADMEIPYVAKGAIESCSFSDNVIVVKKGSNFGTVTVTAGDVEFGDEEKVAIAVDEDAAGARFVSGENTSITLNIAGMLKLSSLVGTWEFDSIYDEEELADWFFMEDDDPDLLPLNNEGFTFTIAEKTDEDGNVTGYTFTPSATGDFAKYFRSSDITYTAPDHLVADSEIVGAYCAIEPQMFYMDIMDDYLYNTFFELSNVNRKFDSDSESLGKGMISLCLTEEGLVMCIRDYDQPPFGENWWDDEEPDPDMFTFASLFTKAE